MRMLIVGDPHATAEELGDCTKLIDYVLKVNKENDVTSVLFLGDLYHTHAAINVEVLAFWRRSFERLAEVGLEVYVLLGNHDMPGNEASTSHALMAHLDQAHVHVIDKPRVLNGVGFIPYQSSKEAFVAAAKGLRRDIHGVATIICHQTFDGSKYENGFFAKDGVDGNLIDVENIISGHIHTPQTFGKVWYPGAPRWRTLSDANITRAIWLVGFKELEGTIISMKEFSTDEVCRRIETYVLTPDSRIEEFLRYNEPGDNDIRIDLKGPQSWLDEMKSQFCGFKVRTFCTDAVAARVKESDGVDVAFKKWVDGYRAKRGTPTLQLAKMASQRLGAA